MMAEPAKSYCKMLAIESEIILAFKKKKKTVTTMNQVNILILSLFQPEFLFFSKKKAFLVVIKMRACIFLPLNKQTFKNYNRHG